MTTETRFFTIAEAAALLRQSRSTLYRNIKRGAMRAMRLGEHGPLRVPEDALEEYLRPARPDNQGERDA